MNDNKLQTKRKAQKGFRALYARTIGKKVRASTAASADELDGDVPNVGIGKALTVILILHVVAIGVIWLGTQWKKGEKEAVYSKSNPFVENGEGITENQPSESSEPTDDNAGTVTLGVPSSYSLENSTATNTVEPRRRNPQVIKPKRNPNKDIPKDKTTTVASKSYKIQAGDNFYRIAKKLKIKQQQLTDMNPSVNTNKLKIGMEIKIPE